MKEHSIILSTLEVQAILRGDKTQKRIPIKPQPVLMPDGEPDRSSGYAGTIWTMPGRPAGEDLEKSCPYKPGDLIYVREALYSDSTGGARYSADGEELFINGKRPDDEGIWSWDCVTEKAAHVSSAAMPKMAARIWLQVESVRAEKLGDISEEDAIAEGIQQEKHEFEMIAYPNGYVEEFKTKPVVWQRKNYLKSVQTGVPHYSNMSAKESFITLLQSIHGKESWNPETWVWAITYKIVSTTGKDNILNQ